MDKRIDITVESKLKPSSSTEEVMTFQTEAKYKKSARKCFLTYTETESTGVEGCKCLLSYDGTKVTIKRFGLLESTLTLYLNESVYNSYQTPYGQMTIETEAKHIHWEDEEHLDIKLVYHMRFEDGGDTLAQISIHS